MALHLIPTPKPFPFSSPFPLYATSRLQVAAFISGLLLHMLYGSRERASGRQSTCVGNPLGAAPRKGLLSINPASPLLPEGLRGRVGRGAIATALLQEQLLGGCWDSGLAQVQPHRQKLQFCSVSFPSLLLPGTVLTASRHT